MESINLMRVGKAQIEANPDGITVAGPLMEAMAALGLLSVQHMADPNSSVFAAQVDFVRPQFETGRSVIWQITPGNSRADQINAGRDYVRMGLAATALGVAMQPWSQALQEYPEMADSHAAMREILGVAPSQGLQMLARAGYAESTPKPSPRWPMESRLIV
jgi:hypothetical protein